MTRLGKSINNSTEIKKLLLGPCKQLAYTEVINENDNKKKENIDQINFKKLNEDEHHLFVAEISQQ